MGCISSGTKRPVVLVSEKSESTYDPRLSILGGGTRPNNLNIVFTMTGDAIRNSIQWDDQEEIVSALISQFPDSYIYPFTKYTLITQTENHNSLYPHDEGEVKSNYGDRMYALVDTKGWKSLITSNFLTISEVGYYIESQGSNQEIEMRLFYVTTNRDNASFRLVTPVIANNTIALELVDLSKEMKGEGKTIRLQARLKLFIDGLVQRNVFTKVPGDYEKTWYFAFKSKETQLYWTVNQGRIDLTNKREDATECRMENLTQSINFD
ncbi:hypothetical protein LOD99_4294 [Oopsacas minuta]|uniref:Uncharacterized protein n=1 Tax=Oopsacas minuta TaxID=111878 RepID=A0AAV7JVE5_9METZ|nr:hypothetical protein LOD99_4294 [Oopsacas minuta]